MRPKITAKRVRREGINLDGREKMNRILTKRPYAPGVHGPTSRTRQTDYGAQLREKQRAKLVFGIMEKQFRNYFDKASNMKGDSGVNLVTLLERRLDSVLFRAGFAKTRASARQIVGHKHVTVNGKLVNIPSYQVKVGDIVSIRDQKRGKGIWKLFSDTTKSVTTPSWISTNLAELSSKITSMPVGDDLKQVFDPKRIVEFYSR